LADVVADQLLNSARRFSAYCPAASRRTTK
jgi:hypothetical protein